MPPNHQKYVQWNGERFREWAATVGESTAVVVESFLTMKRVEQQGYKSCLSLLKLTDQYSVDRIESACAKALSYTPRPSLKSIQTILKSGQDRLASDESNSKTPVDTSEYGFTRGADYYKKRGDE